MNDSYQQILYKLAMKAYKKGDIPVAAILVKDNKIVAKAYNKRFKNNSLLGHAEIICILKGTKKLKSWRLTDCDLYVTLEPCAMCREVIRKARVENVYYLCDKTKNVVNKTHFIKLNSSTNDLYSRLLTDFFDTLRK